MSTDESYHIRFLLLLHDIQRYILRDKAKYNLIVIELFTINYDLSNREVTVKFLVNSFALNKNEFI